VEDGLPHDVCYGIHQDQKGFMWIGTDLGLVRFDGNTFHPYGLEDGLPNPYIITVGETPQGQIWSTPYEGGIHYLEEEKFEKNPYVDPYFWYHPKVHYISDSIAFLQDLRTDLYSGITGLIYPGEASHFVRWYHINGELEGRRIQIENEADSYNKFLIHQTYDDDRVASLCFWSNRQYQLWLGTEEGLFMLDDPENLTTHLAHPDLAGVPVYGLHGNEVGDLIINSRSKIYLLQEDGSLSSFDLPSGVPSPPKIKISNGRKAYWGDALGAQFWTLDLKTGAFTSLTPYLQLGANISQFEIDREEGVWISTDGDGCHVLRNQGFQNLGKETGLKSLFINDFLLQDNSIFIAHKKGVEILEEIEGGRFQLIERSEYPKKEIYKLRNNDEGDIYISGLQGIRKIYPETKLLIPNQLPDVGLYQSNKFIMLLTDGVYIQSEGEKPEKWVEETYDKTLGDYGIEKGLHGDYYIRSKIGLLRLDPNSKSKTASGLISLDTIHIDLPILAITKSASGEIYYTSADSLYKLSPTGTQTFPLDRKQIGILKNIAVDDSNYVWLGTTTGLHKWSEKRTISFHEEDGLTSSDITSLYRDPKGRLWIGTSRGISLLRNPAKRQAREAPSIFLNSISLDGTPIEEEQLQQLKSTNTLNIKYDVIELQNPDNLSFQFQLYEGSAWQDVSSRELTLTNLSIGTYQVRFRAKNSRVIGERWLRSNLK
jgi:ligand-binding sensor domain-containing protein